MPSVKISTQAIMLQMAAADLFGQPNYQKFDRFTVSLAHPDAMLALMNDTGGVNAHFSSSPFYEQEIKLPGAHVLTTSYDILGGRGHRAHPGRQHALPRRQPEASAPSTTASPKRSTSSTATSRRQPGSICRCPATSSAPKRA